MIQVVHPRKHWHIFPSILPKSINIRLSVNTATSSPDSLTTTRLFPKQQSNHYTSTNHQHISLSHSPILIIPTITRHPAGNQSERHIPSHTLPCPFRGYFIPRPNHVISPYSMRCSPHGNLWLLIKYPPFIPGRTSWGVIHRSIFSAL